VNAVGGIEALKTKLLALDQVRAASGSRGSVLSFVPDVGSAWMPMLTFFVYIAVNWWATWYPGAEPGGGGYVAQRMLSAKDEKNSLLATLWFNIAHYAIRPWPWILVALASLILFPNLKDPETGYVRVMIDYLPSSLRGLMVAAFAAAFMSPSRNQEHSKPISPRKRTSLKLFSPANGEISGPARHAASRFLKDANCAWIANLRGRYKTQPLRHFFPSSLRRKKAGCTRTSI